MCILSRKRNSQTNHLLTLKDKVYHTSHPDNNATGGSAIFIKNNIAHHEELEYKTEHI